MAREKKPMKKRKCHIRDCKKVPVGSFMFRQQKVAFCEDHKNLADK